MVRDGRQPVQHEDTLWGAHSTRGCGIEARTSRNHTAQSTKSKLGSIGEESNGQA